jgi:GNAT superfamily N-acetyltransferase
LDRVLPFSSVDAREALLAALAGDRDAVSLTAAVVQDVIVGAVVSATDRSGSGRELLAVGVEPGHRGHGLATAMLRAHVDSLRPGDDAWRAAVTVAERDAVEPLDRALRADVARRLLGNAGFRVRPADGALRSIDAYALEAVRGG